MVVVHNLIMALVSIFEMLVSAYTLVVVAACLLSWVNPDPYNPIVRVLRNLTEPLLWRIRKYLPFTYFRGLDFSPIVLLLGLQLVNMVVLKSVRELL